MVLSILWFSIGDIMIDEAYTGNEVVEASVLTHESLRSGLYEALQDKFIFGRLVMLLNTYAAFDVGRRSVVYIDQAPSAFSLACYEYGVLQFSVDYPLHSASKDISVKQAFLFLTDLLSVQEIHNGIESLYSEIDLDEPDKLIDIVTFYDGSIGTRRFDQDIFHIRSVQPVYR